MSEGFCFFTLKMKIQALGNVYLTLQPVTVRLDRVHAKGWRNGWRNLFCGLLAATM